MTLAFAQGGRFAVSRARVHARPRAFYAALLQELSKSTSPIQGYWMEAAWYDVFHPEALQAKAPLCPLPEFPDGLGLSITDLKQEIIERALEDGLVDASARSLSGLYVYTYSDSSTSSSTSPAPSPSANNTTDTSAPPAPSPSK